MAGLDGRRLQALAVLAAVAVVSGCEEYKTALTFSALEVITTGDGAEAQWRVECAVDGSEVLAQEGTGGPGQAVLLMETVSPPALFDGQAMEVSCQLLGLSDGEPTLLGSASQTHTFSTDAHPFGAHLLDFIIPGGRVRLHYVLARHPDTISDPELGEEVTVRLGDLWNLSTPPELPSWPEAWTIDCVFDGVSFHHTRDNSASPWFPMKDKLSSLTYTGRRHRATVLHCVVQSRIAGAWVLDGLATHTQVPVDGVWPTGTTHELHTARGDSELWLTYSLIVED